MKYSRIEIDVKVKIKVNLERLVNKSLNQRGRFTQSGSYSAPTLSTCTSAASYLISITLGFKVKYLEIQPIKNKHP